MYVYICVYMCIYVYICVYMYIHMYYIATASPVGGMFYDPAMGGAAVHPWRGKYARSSSVHQRHVRRKFVEKIPGTGKSRFGNRWMVDVHTTTSRRRCLNRAMWYAQPILRAILYASFESSKHRLKKTSRSERIEYSATKPASLNRFSDTSSHSRFGKRLSS